MYQRGFVSVAVAVSMYEAQYIFLQLMHNMDIVSFQTENHPLSWETPRCRIPLKPLQAVLYNLSGNILMKLLSATHSLHTGGGFHFCSAYLVSKSSAA